MMRQLIGLTLVSALAATPGNAQETTNPTARFATSLGHFTIELFADEAPKTVENFLEYIDSGFYEGTTFHRVKPGFVVQGGGFTADMQKKSTRPPVANEADNGLRNTRGTLSMARTMNPDSATSQFFVNLVDNTTLDHTARTTRGWGYAVFATVIDGMETIDKIAAVETGASGMMQRDVPVEPVVIQKVTVTRPEPSPAAAD